MVVWGGMNRVRNVVAVISVLASIYAATVAAVEPAVESALKAALEKPDAGMLVESISDTDMPELFQVKFVNGPTVIAHRSGQFFVLGDLFRVLDDGYMNLSELARNEVRAKQIASVKKSDTIVFAPEGETRAVISIFTDNTCFYCRKLHQEVPQLNAFGIEVRYLAYPRSGLNSPSYRQLVTAWCAQDQQQTLTTLKSDEEVAIDTCSPNPVAEQFQLGQDMGVRGTPAIILESGEMIPGYKPAQDIAQLLGLL